MNCFTHFSAQVCGCFFLRRKKPSGESDTVEGAAVPEKNSGILGTLGLCYFLEDVKIGRDFSPEN